MASEQKKQKFRPANNPYSINSSANERDIPQEKGKDLLLEFQVKKCVVSDDMHLASGGNHQPKMVSNYRRCRKYVVERDKKEDLLHVCRI